MNRPPTIYVDPRWAKSLFPYFLERHATECVRDLLQIHFAKGQLVLARAAAGVALADSDVLPASALAALPLPEDGSLPSDIQMFPPGAAVDFTLQDYPGQTFQMKVDEKVAAKAQADLERFLAAEASGRGSQPFADKNHEDAEATFHPGKIFWGGNDPKSGGVRVQTHWTPFGAALVQAKAFKYFSGNFLFNKATNQFLGLINENIGGLVNRPGFAAQQAFAKAAPSSKPTTITNMTDKEIQDAISNGITAGLAPVITALDTLEASAKGATAAAAKAGSELDKNPTIVSLEARLKAIESNTSETVKASARATVATLGVKAGRIGAQDTETIAFWENAIAANAKAADALAKMPVNPAFARIAPGDTPAAPGDETEFAQLVAAKAKAGKTKAEAIAEVVQENNAAYVAWLKAGAGKL